METQFLTPPREMKIGLFEKLGFREVRGKIAVFELVKKIQEKQLLIRVIGRFDKSQVRGIGIPL